MEATHKQFDAQHKDDQQFDSQQINNQQLDYTMELPSCLDDSSYNDFYKDIFENPCADTYKDSSSCLDNNLCNSYLANNPCSS